MVISKPASRGYSVKNVFLEVLQNSQENRVSFLKKLQVQVCNFIKKETLALVFSCEFFEISKNTFSYRTPPVAASSLPYLSFIMFIYFAIVASLERCLCSKQLNEIRMIKLFQKHNIGNTVYFTNKIISLHLQS